MKTVPPFQRCLLLTTLALKLFLCLFHLGWQFLNIECCWQMFSPFSLWNIGMFIKITYRKGDKDEDGSSFSKISPAFYFALKIFLCLFRLGWQVFKYWKLLTAVLTIFIVKYRNVHKDYIQKRRQRWRRFLLLEDVSCFLLWHLKIPVSVPPWLTGF